MPRSMTGTRIGSGLVSIIGLVQGAVLPSWSMSTFRSSLLKRFSGLRLPAAGHPEARSRQSSSAYMG
jgi:hypothetical protein